MTNSLVYPIPDTSAMKVQPTSATRGKFQYKDGQRTDQPDLHDGKPIFVFTALIEINGQMLEGVRVETTTPDLPPPSFMQIWSAQGAGEIRVRPESQWEINVTVLLPKIITTAARRSGEGS